MPKRQTQFILGGTYHILNRGVNKMPIFLSKADYKRFECLIEYYRFERKMPYSHYRLNKRILDARYRDLVSLVNILSYCSMPNHFHLQVQSTEASGVERFTNKLLLSYAMYFNKKYRRIGPVYQNRFRSVEVHSGEQFTYLSAYIHRNPLEAGIVDTPEALINYPYSSLGHYFGFNPKPFIDKKPVLSYFEDSRDYYNYLFKTRGLGTNQDPELLA